MRVIEDQKEFHISIKDLIYATRERTYYSSTVPFRIRMAKGIEVHQGFQDKRYKSQQYFQKEAPVKIEFAVEGWKFIITGRADAVFEIGSTFIVEEIKSVSDIENFSLDSPLAQEYRTQLLLYAHYFTLQGKNVEAHLVIIDMISEITQILEVPLEDLTFYIQNQCKVLLSSWNLEKDYNSKQRKRAKTISFPFDEYRPSQKEIIDASEACLESGGRLMLLAPSGLGKTIGTLFPALQYTIKNNKRLFIVTSKTTQQRIYRDTLKVFEKKKACFQSIVLTAKEKICINSAFICEPAFCPYVDGYEQKPIEEYVVEMLTHKVIDATLVKKYARKHEVCPFELSLDCSLSCDVIVGDYNYVFHPFIKLKRYFDQPYEDSILIVDEAHNLPTRANDYYSPEITLKELQNTMEFLRTFHLTYEMEQKGLKVLQSVSNYILKLLQEVPATNRSDVLLSQFNKSFFRSSLKDFDQFVLEYAQYLTKLQGFQPSGKDKVIDFSMNLRQFYLILQEVDTPEFSPLLYTKDNKIKLLCKSASGKLEGQLKGFHSVIMQSATLFPMEYFQKMLGLPSSTTKIQFNSPYAQENRLYMIYPHVSTKYEYRSDSYAHIAALICDSVNIKWGNYLAFFPSFSFLNAVKRELEHSKLKVELIVQERSMNEKQRRDILKKLQTGDKKYLLLGVHGGIFSEGVDFIGDMAIGAFIVGPGLPAYSLEQELMKQYFDFRWQRGFDYAYRNPGITKVIQAAGRIFRTFEDRGFVILVGQRFNTGYYKSILPSDWNLEIPTDIIDRIREFWGEEKIPKKRQDLFDLMGKL